MQERLDPFRGNWSTSLVLNEWCEAIFRVIDGNILRTERAEAVEGTAFQPHCDGRYSVSSL